LNGSKQMEHGACSCTEEACADEEEAFALLWAVECMTLTGDDILNLELL
jgi:hypothetical protein